MEATSANLSSRDRMRPLRYLWRIPLVLLHIVLAILICALVLSWAGGVMKNGREPFAHRAIRLWSVLLLRIFGFRSRRFGTPLADPVLFVANHTSWLDITVVHSQRAACFVAKAEIAGWPLVGWMAARGGTIFHRRGSNHSLASVMAVMVERLRAGRAVAVFPEGGTGHNGVLRIFHARIFQAALDAEVPVQPVALRFARQGRRVIDAGFRENETFMGNVIRLLGEAPLDVEVHFLEPVPVSADGRRRMAEASRERIALALDTDTPA
ncbi:1-acyl-sn-glycerol-3-phosphate acyltransferase [Luteibacter rhizovicinus DSM 16549]|uniref:1-acyl-sn-glycerol-3-phosphate acyltransferase n=1 Tax=Luteibacter rhizovicinus DSM 16549 TaxID=1440763 RepID=A0A0G9HM98_9GAMM|nr:lysophospholipid acyltransferase family protein [Luteibacter rhizovicinus]APG03632.1 1-acyl-sn-glycerol-3-phosphate acyltransferase [Luteibacter rhizovicinus DSM 16549]KLD68797.1 acetyltransferase [Luteibacter rhizovicinus DSM 16549]